MDLWKKWKEKECEFFEKSIRSLRFDYSDQNNKDVDIAEALALGKFIQRWIRPNDNVIWKECWEFLASFQETDNELLRLMTFVGSMPTEVFTKVLWEYNIDFASPEAFLRRITPEQIKAIEDNCKDLMNGNVPRAYSRWQKTFGKISVKDLLSKQDWRGYKTKGSWAYNLGKLDWGFPLYPNGSDDDTQAPKINPFSAVAKFVRIKGDKEKFVVNNIDGKYWKLYKPVRSNYVINSGKHVEIGTHICPGFWHTFLAHATFWIISPMMLLLLLYLQPSMSLLTICASAIAMITPLWCVIALSKYFMILLIRLLEDIFVQKMPSVMKDAIGFVIAGIVDANKAIWRKIGNEVNSWSEKTVIIVRTVFATLFALIVLAIIGSIYAHYMPFVKEVFNSWFDANLIVGAIILYLFYKIKGKVTNCHFTTLSEFPIWVKTWLGLATGVLFLHFMTMYGKILINPLFLAIFLGDLCFLGAILILINMDISKKQYIIFERITFGIMSIVLLIGIFCAFKLISMGIMSTSMFYGGLLLFVGGFWGLFYFSEWYLNPDINQARTIANDDVLLSWSISKNPWLLSLNRDEIREVQYTVQSMVHDIFSSNNSEYMRKVLEHITQRSLETICNSKIFFKVCLEKEDVNEQCILQTMELVSKKGFTVEQSFDIVYRKHRKYQKRVKTIKLLLKIIFAPIWIAMLVVGWIFSQLARVKELYQLYNFFSNKICPQAEKQMRTNF